MTSVVHLEVFCGLFTVLLAYTASEPNNDIYEIDGLYTENKQLTGHYYYGGDFTGRCGLDGLYYKDRRSYVICSNGNSFLQACAPGTSHSEAPRLKAGYYYGEVRFCDVNLVDYGYSRVFHNRDVYRDSDHDHHSINKDHPVSNRAYIPPKKEHLPLKIQYGDGNEYSSLHSDYQSENRDYVPKFKPDQYKEPLTKLRAGYEHLNIDLHKKDYDPKAYDRPRNSKIDVLNAHLKDSLYSDSYKDTVDSNGYEHSKNYDAPNNKKIQVLKVREERRESYTEGHDKLKDINTDFQYKEPYDSTHSDNDHYSRKQIIKIPVHSSKHSFRKPYIAEDTGDSSYKEPRYDTEKYGSSDGKVTQSFEYVKDRDIYKHSSDISKVKDKYHRDVPRGFYLEKKVVVPKNDFYPKGKEPHHKAVDSYPERIDSRGDYRKEKVSYSQGDISYYTPEEPYLDDSDAHNQKDGHEYTKDTASYHRGADVDKYLYDNQQPHQYEVTIHKDKKTYEKSENEYPVKNSYSKSKPYRRNPSHELNHSEHDKYDNEYEIPNLERKKNSYEYKILDGLKYRNPIEYKKPSKLRTSVKLYKNEEYYRGDKRHENINAEYGRYRDEEKYVSSSGYQTRTAKI